MLWRRGHELGVLAFELQHEFFVLPKHVSHVESMLLFHRGCDCNDSLHRVAMKFLLAIQAIRQRSKTMHH